MIRALIGRFVLRCIQAEEARQVRARRHVESRRIDRTLLTPDQLLAFYRGQAVDLRQFPLTTPGGRS